MKYRAKKSIVRIIDGLPLTTIGRIYDIEEVNKNKYRFKNNVGYGHYLSEEILKTYFEKVEEKHEI